MIKSIQSADNVIYKSTLNLQQKKHRDVSGQYMIEGPNLLEEALKNKAELTRVFLREEMNEHHFEVINLLKEIQKRKIDVFSLSNKLFERLSDTKTPQGMIGVVKKPQYSEKSFFNQNHRPKGNLLVLDRLQDPGNLGTIIRTADAAGFQGVILCKGTGDIFSPKVVRSAAGALFRLPIFLTNSAEETICLLRKYKKRILATTLQNSKVYYEADLCENIGLIIGNEGNGICKEFIDEADEAIRIPMSEPVESLNAAVAAGILMYETVRQKER